MPTEPELKAKISLDATSWEAGMRQVSSGLSGLAGEFGAITNTIASAFGVYALQAQARAIIDYGGKINDLATRTKISTDALQEYDYAAKLTSGSLDSFVTAVQRLSVAQVNAVRDGGSIVDDFRNLGVTVDDLKRKSPEEIFRQIAERVRQSKGGAVELDAVLAVMGKSADEILPAMREGFKQMAAELDAIGGKIGPDVIKKLDDYGDAWTRFATKIRKVGADFIVTLGNAVELTKQLSVAAYAKLTGDVELGTKMAMATYTLLHQYDEPSAQPGSSKKKELLAPGNIYKSAFPETSGRSPLIGNENLPINLGVTPWQRIGAFVGGPDRQLSVMERQVAWLQKIEANTAKYVDRGNSDSNFPTR